MSNYRHHCYNVVLRLGISKNPIGTGGLWTKIAPLGSTENCRINFSFLSSIIFYVFFTPNLWASKGTPSALEKNIIPWQNTHLLGTSPHSEHCLYLSDSCHPLSFALQKCWCSMQTLDSESLSGTQLGACFFFFFSLLELMYAVYQLYCYYYCVKQLQKWMFSYILLFF